MTPIFAYHTDTGRFAGNAAPGYVPPEGIEIAPVGFPPGMNDPHYLDGEWIAGDPPEEMPPIADYGNAWRQLTTSETWGWLNGTAAALGDVLLVQAMGNLGMAFLGWRDSDPTVWRLGMQAGCEAIYNRLAALEVPLPEEHETWLEAWSDANNLELEFCWEAEE
jgi:hypothetical protein